jgi:hypothetical protein
MLGSAVRRSLGATLMGSWSTNGVVCWHVNGSSRCQLVDERASAGRPVKWSGQTCIWRPAVAELRDLVTQLPEINWNQIRGKGPSGRRDGFEELCNQLMIYGGLVTWPPGTTFTAFGNPDGGREGRGELPGGATWGWQAKYLFALDDGAFTQIDESVRRVLTTEPTLERYFVLLPCNRPAGDTAKAKSAWTKWNEHVTRWEVAAAAAGRTVTFKYLGETQLNNCLLQPSQVVDGG